MEAGTAVRSPDEEALAQQAAEAGDPPEPTPESEAGALEGEHPEEQARIAIQLPGDGQLSLQVGGNKPDKATVKLRGGSIEVPDGQYKKGDLVNLLIKVQCAEVHFVDKIDNSTGEIVGTERRQIFKVKGVERVE